VVLAVDGTDDHVHLLLQLSSKTSLAELMKQVKGVSSAMVNDRDDLEERFRWQEGYGAFSVSRSHLPRVIAYINNQKQHHAAGTTLPQWEETDEEKP
jgi:REP element-mobilizing transposase RayT